MTTSSYNIKKLNNKLDSLIKALNGAKGSGNFGHAGRPGKVGGSGSGNGMSTKSDSILHDTVKQMADIFSTMNKREGYKYSSSEDLVLKQGKFFTPEKRPENIELGSKKECFANASKLALARSDLTYVEGYAMINDRLPLPIAHAWCVDKKGRVIDNTWEKPGVSYFGVPFKTSYLAKKLSETGVYGILSGSVGTSDFLKDGVPSEGIANIKKQKNTIKDDEYLVSCSGLTTEEPLSKKINQLIYKINKITGKGGNPYHDEKGRFASGPSSSSKSGSKSSIIEKGGMEGGYIIDTLDEFDDEQLSKLVKNPIANLSEKRLKEVASMRKKMYGTKEEFNRANQWLLSIVGNGADIMQKAKDLDFDPSKEIKLSRKIIGDKEVTLFRNQEGEFDKKNYKESRWGDIPHSHSSSGNDYTIKGNKNNILIHPEVLYSADIDDSYYRNEREYVVDNSKIKDVWRGVKL